MECDFGLHTHRHFSSRLNIYFNYGLVKTGSYRKGFDLSVTLVDIQHFWDDIASITSIDNLSNFVACERQWIMMDRMNHRWTPYAWLLKIPIWSISAFLLVTLLSVRLNIDKIGTHRYFYYEVSRVCNLPTCGIKVIYFKTLGRLQIQWYSLWWKQIRNL